jgi:isoquinoline 1-oxidoreductase beta subunit
MKTPDTLQDSRRRFLKRAGGVLFAISLPFGVTSLTSCNPEEEAARDDSSFGAGRDYPGKEVTLWVQLHENDEITILSPTNEMGQGSMTALAILIAEELDADWSKVRVEHSPVDAEIYGSQGWSGRSMMTVGSRTVRTYYESLREAGAQARYVLLANAARHWAVPIAELRTEPNVVLHAPTGRRLTYGELATFVEPLDEIPAMTAADLKAPADFRLIGKGIDRVDIPAKVDGSARYAIDVQLPDMVYGVVDRAPVNGGSPTLKNEAAIRALDGVLDVVPLAYGIGVLAASVEQALRAKSQLEIDWSAPATAESHNSTTAFADYERVAAGRQPARGEAIVNEGDIASALQAGAATYTRDYRNDYVVHAQMEPLNAIVSIAADGASAEVWVGTQAPDQTRIRVAELLDIAPDRVTMHRYYLGGGFGRRSSTDFVEETVLLAQAAQRPVKLLWTREDDIRYGMFRPMSLQRMQASVDAAGQITGWRHIIVGPGGGLLSSGAETPFYRFPNRQVVVHDIDHGVRTKHWRAVGHGPNKFAIEAFLDEIAADLGKDPLDFRLELMEGQPRAQAVLRKAAEMADWSAPAPEGRAKGIAFAERSGSLAACVCELSVDADTGRIRVHHLWSALDAGVVVQPDNAIAQMEGGLIMGLSSVLKESITIENGRVQQSNYDDYPILRMDEIPDKVEIALIPSTEPPMGIGESGVPIIGGAVANAFARLTGQRLRHLPFTAEKVLGMLNS